VAPQRAIQSAAPMGSVAGDNRDDSGVLLDTSERAGLPCGTLKRRLANSTNSVSETDMRLSEFAKKQELDQALMALWEEIKHYPARAKQKDGNRAWNRLGVEKVGGSEEGQKITVAFSYAAHQYAISSTVRDPKFFFPGDEELVTDFDLLEDGKEVFAISCSKEFDEQEASNKCLSVNAFKRHGEWAKMLIQLHCHIRQKTNKNSKRKWLKV
jgi:hypothetical protein